MTSTRRFHGPGVGGRTGMRVTEDIRSISSYLEAGRRAMDEHRESSIEDSMSQDKSCTSGADRTYERSCNTEYSHGDPGPSSSRLYSSPRTRTTLSVQGSGPGSDRPGSSSVAMDLENSYAPSPDSRRASRTYTDTANRSHTGVSADGSVIDYGSDEEVAPLSPQEAELSRRSALSVGQNRGRISAANQAGSRRQSRFELSEPRASYGGNEESPSMTAVDVDGGNIPSFHVDETPDFSAVLHTSDPMSGFEAERFLDSVEGPGDDGEGASGYPEGHDEQVLDDAALQNGETDGKEGAPIGASLPKRKRGRPPKNKSKTTEAVGKVRPNAEMQGAMIKERIASSRERAGSAMDRDVRRSTRHRYAPLEWWRGERAIYGRPSKATRHQQRPDSADAEADADQTIDENVFEDAPVKSYCAPVLKEIIRFTRAPNEGTFTGMNIKKKPGQAGPGRPPKRTKGRKKSSSAAGNDDGSESDADEDLDPTAPSRHVEDGWDDGTDPHGWVFDVERDEEVERKIACPISQLRLQQATNRSFAFKKAFGVDECMAAGILELPVDGEKPTKSTKDNNYTFVVLEGAVDVQVYRTMFRMAPGGMFMVPKGNTYSIRNCCQRTARLFFAQARQAQRPHLKQSVPNGGSLDTARLSASATSPATPVAASSSVLGSPAQPHLVAIREEEEETVSDATRPTQLNDKVPKKRGRPPKVRV